MAELIPWSRLLAGRYYVGRGRNGNVGLWDGQIFLVIGEKFDQRVVKREGYYGLEGGCFQPFQEINEGRVVEAIGTGGWGAHYARVIEFDPQVASEPNEFAEASPPPFCGMVQAILECRGSNSTTAGSVKQAEKQESIGKPD